MTQIWQTIKESAVEAWDEYWRPFLWLLPVSWRLKLSVSNAENSQKFSRSVLWLITTTLASATLAGGFLYALVTYVPLGVLSASRASIFVIVGAIAVLRIAFYLLIIVLRR
ncbi:hypothetical protein H8K52_06775 [Undibacterium seohonense]|uniref:Uncharacterized protein n=1 Tax=Undibacterium seohonense TaxID=1344950 RepID=A0ABR6X3V8_9BURK|nr:hypothetical protein [Undibacterium seohonense]MBC3807046.1 hypothetical protein [Undibacterium seohonense]